MTPGSEALLSTWPDVDGYVDFRLSDLRTALERIEAAARSDIEARVETEWINGNLSDDVRDRILGTTEEPPRILPPCATCGGTLTSRPHDGLYGQHRYVPSEADR